MKQICVIAIKRNTVDELSAFCYCLFNAQTGLDAKLRPVVIKIDVRSIDQLIIQEVITDRAVENRC